MKKYRDSSLSPNSWWHGGEVATTNTNIQINKYTNKYTNTDLNKPQIHTDSNKPQIHTDSSEPQIHCNAKKYTAIYQKYCNKRYIVKVHPKGFDFTMT